MDLDRFKLLNDTHGHAVGDAVLCRFVRVIEAELPEGALFGRMGGEEFLVVVALDRDASAADFGWDLVKAVRRDIAERGGVATTVSVGLAVGPMDGRTLSDLMERADERLYDAKSAGRNRLIVPNWLGETCPQLVEAK